MRFAEALEHSLGERKMQKLAKGIAIFVNSTRAFSAHILFSIAFSMKLKKGKVDFLVARFLWLYGSVWSLSKHQQYYYSDDYDDYNE